MRFEWSDTQDQLYQAVKSFARAELNHDLERRRLSHLLCSDAWHACARMGLLGLSVPKQHGGSGLDSLTTAHVMEAFGEGCEDMGLLFSAAAHLNACAMPIAEHGSDDLKQRVLPGLCDGSRIGANAISEANAGSDLAALKTRATRDGDGYVIDGEKSFVTNGAVADVFTVYAVTEPGAGYLGISAFLVERESPGVQPGKPFDKLGLTTAQTGPVLFDGCRVPASHLLGSEGQGLKIFNRSMAWERTCLFAGYLGQMQRQLDSTIKYAAERKQFGKAIARNQAVSHRIVDMKVRLESARMLLYRACWAIDQGLPAELYISMAKLAISEAAVTSALDAIRVHGGLGVVMESGVPQALADSVPCTIFSGTSDLQRNIIARELGL
jgi:alkylation response protein AidB-like acyl-CoA dehydrogenase